MRNPLNTLFGRMALLSTIVLLAIQSSWFIVLAIREPQHDADGFAHGILLALQTAGGQETNFAPAVPGPPVRPMPFEAMPANPAFHAEAAPPTPPTQGTDYTHRPPGLRMPPMPLMRTVPWNKVPSTIRFQAPKDPQIARTVAFLRERLPAGSTLEVDDGHPPHLWVRAPGAAYWTVVPLRMRPPPHLLIETGSILIAAIVLSTLVAWQMQRPLSRVARAARTFGAGGRPAPVGERGPRELRELINAFNDMMRRLNEADDDQAVMLAGVAHDLKAPLTRLKLRASLLREDEERAGLLHDVNSLSNIVQQFLEFAGQSVDEGAPIEVDAFMRRQFTVSEAAEGPLFELDLQAGPQFKLPATMLDRLMTNLVDNALEHGSPPVHISTARNDGDWVLIVRDAGPGIAEDRIAAAMKPFVRLDAARGGEGHCGLGLAIVSRLIRDRGGRCELGNHRDGGLQVKVVLPAVAEPAACRV